MHNNFQLCAEEYLFLVLIYHGFLLFSFWTYPSSHKKKEKKKKIPSSKTYFVYKVLI